MGKNIEKTFTKEAVHHNVVAFDEKPILQLIQDHLIREGQFEFQLYMFFIILDQSY
jgi:hypothetical protein